MRTIFWTTVGLSIFLISLPGCSGSSTPAPENPASDLGDTGSSDPEGMLDQAPAGQTEPDVDGESNSDTPDLESTDSRPDESETTESKEGPKIPKPGN